MIPVLRSIDSLLNRFDELSQRHTTLVSNFDKNFTNIENPLRDVTRNEEERKKTTESILKSTMKIDDQIKSYENLTQFNRYIIKSRCHNRPPSYSSYESPSFTLRTPSRGSLESILSPSTEKLPSIQTTTRANTSQSVATTPINNHIKKNIQLTTKIKPKIPPATQWHTRTPITMFSMETANRLSKPRKYYQTTDPTTLSKQVYRRSIPKSPEMKRTNPITIKLISKKLKPEYNCSIDKSKNISINNESRPVRSLTSPKTIRLAFPVKLELNPSPIVVTPKATSTPKTLNIFTNRKSLISSNRMKYLMT
ncbi:unnamed protein product [Adineta steineri]|uniref:Uncharacterized protein n=1 Tax=Adineta steineri TaxID=433720 RepID=A0A813RAD9_9BILA|nr:unnamed protein product [Adineta steineri]